MIKVKIFTGISLFLFIVTVGALFIAAFLSQSNQKLARTNGAIIGLNGVQRISSADSDSALADVGFLTLEIVAAHSTPQDCWMIIDGGVYDLTSFLSAHPGGSAVMQPYCGQDGSAAFVTKDKQPPSKHSTLADSMLSQYFLGRLGQQLAGGGSAPSDTPPGGLAGRLQFSLPSITPSALVGSLTASAQNSTAAGLSLSASEVARHNNPADCWVIISGRVYNLTSYLIQHPGGVSAISQYCGGDGSTGFATKNSGSSHSGFATSLLSSYLVGSIGQTVAVIPPSPTNPPTINPTSIPVIPTAPPSNPTPLPANLVLDQAEVSRHNNLADCWIIVSGQVYNVTRYIVSHPGGQSAISNTCGTDATTAFNTRGGSGSHSNTARNLLANYLIGPFNSSVIVNPTATLPPGAPPTATPVPNTGSDLPQAILNRYPGATRQSGGYEDNGSWEGKISTSSGTCREMKVDSGGSITEDKTC